MIEQAITAAIVDGRVPTSISADYLVQDRNQPAKIAILCVGVLTFFIVGLRCCSRIFLAKRFGLDDALAVLSLTLQLAFMALCIYLINLGSGRHIEYIRYVLTNDQSKKTETLDFAAHLIYTTALFICRLSGLAFYQRLCELHDHLSLAIKCAATFLVAAYIPQMCLIIFHCNQVTSLWPYSWQLGLIHRTCLTWGIVYLTNSALSLFCDIFMFVIPGALIYVLKLSLNRKLRLYIVLLPGILVIVISIVRLYLVVQGQWLADGSWFYCPMVAIENAEIGGTLIALSIPGLKPLFGLCLWKTDRSLKHSESLPNRTATSPTVTSDIGSQLKVVITIGSQGSKPVPGHDSFLEFDEESSGGTYEVIVQTTETLPEVPRMTHPGPGDRWKGCRGPSKWYNK